ncbi:MAG: AMP-binding protein [Bacillota bacterium]
MKVDVFPPDPTQKNGFSTGHFYEEILIRYPTVAELVSSKAVENGDKTWLVFEDGRNFSYSEVDALSDSMAAGLYGLGVRNDDKVAIFAYNSPEWILSFFAILKMGAVPVTVNTGFIKDPLIYNLKASHSQYLVVDCRLLETYKNVEESLDNIKCVVIIGKQNFDRRFQPVKPYVFAEDLATIKPNPEIKVKKYGKDPCAMILTSGTTGPSKVVADSNAQFICTALFMIEAGGITENSVVYVYLPLFHIMALDLATIASMLANAKMVLAERFNPAVFWEDIYNYGVSHFHAVGPILEILLKNPPSPLEQEHDPIVALAYSSKDVWNRARERFKIFLSGGYGSTEVGIPVSAPYDIVISGKNPPGSCGIVGPHIDVKIMDEYGKFLPVGKVGEIVIRPRIPWTMFLEYYGMPDQTVNAFRGLWFHTGDAGYFDENGYLYFVDRLKDAIRRKGENISSYEVEQILQKHYQILEAAVIPAPLEVGEDEVMAVVVPKPGESIDLKELMLFCEENMPRFWIPRFIRIAGGLPRTPTGRIEKFKLKEEGFTKDTFDMKA